MEEPLASSSFTSCLLRRAWTRLDFAVLLIGAILAWRGRNSSCRKATGWERVARAVLRAFAQLAVRSCLVLLCWTQRTGWILQVSTLQR